MVKDEDIPTIDLNVPTMWEHLADLSYAMCSV